MITVNASLTEYKPMYYVFLSLEILLGRNTGESITYEVAKSIPLELNYCRKISLGALFGKHIGQTCLIARRHFLGGTFGRKGRQGRFFGGKQVKVLRLWSEGDISERIVWLKRWQGVVSCEEYSSSY